MNFLLRTKFIVNTIVCVSPDPAFGSMYLDHVTTQLENLDQIPESTRTIKSFVTHLYPTDFPNIQVGMRSIIAGFVERNDLVPQGTNLTPERCPNIEQTNTVKRKPSTSLANYDINFLIAWFKVLVVSTSKSLDFSNGDHFHQGGG